MDKATINAERQVESGSTGVDEFIMASIRGDINTIKSYLSNKDILSDPNVLDNEGMSALHWASAYDEPKLIKILLLDERVNPNCKGHRQMTPLHKAVQGGSLGSIETLLNDKRIEIDAQNQWKETPLFLAAHNGDIKATFLLLKANANINIQDQWESKPSDVAKSHGFPNISEMINSYEPNVGQSFLKTYLPKRVSPPKISQKQEQSKNKILSKMMEAPLKDDDFLNWIKDSDIDVNGADFYKWTALHKLAAWNKSECLEILLQHDDLTDVMPNGQAGDTPLHAAIEMSAFKCVDVLLNNLTVCSHINIPNNAGNIPLHNAIMIGSKDIVERLLIKNANPTIRNLENISPWNLAKSLPEPYKSEICPVIWDFIQKFHVSDEDLKEKIISLPSNDTHQSNLPSHYGKEERQVKQLNVDTKQLEEHLSQPK